MTDLEVNIRLQAAGVTASSADARICCNDSSTFLKSLRLAVNMFFEVTGFLATIGPRITGL